MTAIFLHVGVTSFPDPGNWNPFDSIVDCVGAGGAGSTGNIVSIPGGWLQRTLGGSGGGGAWSRGQNLQLTFPVPVSIAAANTGALTWFNGTSATPPNVYAPSGGNASGSNVGAGGATGYPVSRAGGSAVAALISSNQAAPGLVWYSRAGGAGGAGGINGAGRFGAQYYNANGIGWAAQTGPSYGGAANATSQNSTPYALDQTLISGQGTTDTSVWGDPVIGLGGGGNGGGSDIASSPQASPQPGMSYFDGATLWIFSNSSPGPGFFQGGTNAGNYNGGAGGLYGGGGGGAAIDYGGNSGVGGNGADGVIAIVYTPYVPLPPGEPPPGWVREYLDTTSGQQYWPDPGNWDPHNNKIECLGSGGAGAGPGTSIGPPDTGDQYGGGGGGGGAYAYANNVPLAFPVPYWIPPQNSAAGSAVNFNVLGSSASTASGAVSAACGTTGNNGMSSTTGAGGQTFFPNGFVGGNGGYLRVTGPPTGGGGGAAGPDGAGGNGAAQVGTPVAQGGVGGTSDGGLIGPGQSGQQWGVGRGTGGGGSGAANATGTPGALYGGGGAGGAPNGTGAPGAAGMVILTWKPLVRSQGSSRFVVAG